MVASQLGSRIFGKIERIAEFGARVFRKRQGRARFEVAVELFDSPFPTVAFVRHQTLQHRERGRFRVGRWPARIRSNRQREVCDRSLFSRSGIGRSRNRDSCQAPRRRNSLRMKRSPKRIDVLLCSAEPRRTCSGVFVRSRGSAEKPCRARLGYGLRCACNSRRAFSISESNSRARFVVKHSIVQKAG